jgi:hypothetical protein
MRKQPTKTANYDSRHALLERATKTDRQFWRNVDLTWPVRGSLNCSIQVPQFEVSRLLSRIPLGDAAGACVCWICVCVRTRACQVCRVAAPSPGLCVCVWSADALNSLNPPQQLLLPVPVQPVRVISLFPP